MQRILLTLVFLTCTYVKGTAQSLDFDGIDDYVSISPSTGINSKFSGNAITLEGWFYPTQSSINYYPMLIGESFLGDGNILFCMYQEGTTINGGFYNGAWRKAASTITLNTWQHIACTYDQANIKLYINGILVDNIAESSPLPAGTEEWRIGMRWDLPDVYQGKMDEVRVWNTANSQAQILDNMNCSLSNTQTNLIANYNFNEGVPNGNNSGVTTLNDISGNFIDGTLSNFSLSGTNSNWTTNAAIPNPAVSVSIAASATTIMSGTPVTFTATVANGGGTPVYQWMLNGSPVGSNSNIYVSDTLIDKDTLICVATSSMVCAANPPVATSNKIGMTVNPNNGSSLDFDGSDDYITTTIDADPDVMPSTTWEGWIYPTTNDANWRMVLANEDGGWDRFVALNGGGIYIGVTTGGWNPASYQINTWQHIAVVFEPGNVRFYLNGVEYVYGGDEGSHSSAGAFTIGANQVGIQHFLGKMDEVRIWDIARTQAQIQASMYCSLPAQSNLIANYNFNDGTPNANNAGVTTLSDISGNAYDGTLLNFALSGTSSNWVGNIYTLDPALSVTISASMTQIFPGTPVTFTATAVNGGASPSYLWLVNGSPVGTNSTVFSSNSLGDHDTVSCKVTSSIQCATLPSVFSNKIGISVSVNNGSSLDFDGNDDYIVIPSSTGINNQFTGNSITVEGWYYPTQASSGVPMLIGESFLGDGNILFTIYQDGLTIYGGFFDGSWHATTGTITLNTWQHIACTYDQSNIKLYINGVLVNSIADSSPLPAGTEEWRLGMRWDLPDFYKGKMDEVRIWNTANSQAKIKDNMNCSISAQANLVASYDFNEGIPDGNNAASDILYDNSGNIYNAALNNFALTGTQSNYVADINTLNPAASVSINATATTLCAGMGATFTATPVNGGTAPSYQWMLNGSPVGTDSDTYSASILSDKDTITCVMSSSISCASVANSNKIGITINPIDTSIAVAGNVLTVGSAIGTYQWIDCGTTSPINGETNQSFAAPGNGTYSVMVTIGSCAATSQCVPLTITGINSTRSESVEVYPNPSNGNFTVTCNPGEEASLQVFDVMGKLVLNQNVQNGQTVINAENLNDGIYMLTISQNQRKSTRQLTITK